MVCARRRNRKVKFVSWLWGLLVGLAFVAFAAHLLHLDDLIRRSIEAGHLLDWTMGGLCFVWLLLILKAPWDLYFEAHHVAWEQQRSRERHVPLSPGRENYVLTVRRRLGWLAVGSHVFSALLVALVAFLNGGVAVGYYFAAFFIVSTIFRPGIAGYVYLLRKLKAVGEEAQYPRDDVVELRARLETGESRIKTAQDEIEQLREQHARQIAQTEQEMQALRQKLNALGREFETTVNRLTDNREVISGIQAFVRLIAQSASSSSSST